MDDDGDTETIYESEWICKQISREKMDGIDGYEGWKNNWNRYDEPI